MALARWEGREQRRNRKRWRTFQPHFRRPLHHASHGSPPPFARGRMNSSVLAARRPVILRCEQSEPRRVNGPRASAAFFEGRVGSPSRLRDGYPLRPPQDDVRQGCTPHFPLPKQKSIGMHCRAARSGAPILRGVKVRMSCRVCQARRCGTRSSATALPRQTSASPQQRRCRRQCFRQKSSRRLPFPSIARALPPPCPPPHITASGWPFLASVMGVGTPFDFRLLT